MKHLIAISLGPVQDFIAAARRTSDLTAGSALLVEIALATAAAVNSAGGRLIFPADVETDGANKILAELPERIEPRRVAEAAKTAARQALRDRWTNAKTKLGAYDLNESLADAQIKGFLEFNAAWVPFGDDAEYSRKRRYMDSLLAARKALRDFSPPPDGVAPKEINAIKGKSPLDPAFECVLNVIPLPRDGEKSEPGLLRLRKTEFLDAVSILKRVAGRGIKGVVPSTRDFARLQKHPGHQAVGDWDTQDNDPEEYPYFAILHADGDRMGQLLDGMQTAEAHRDFSRRLAGFAQQAKRIVESQHGYAVYTGGDDVLALLPVRTAVACARDLADTFGRVIPNATLSAGIAVVHYRQPLALSLEAARAAERQAKTGGRNALCLAIHARGGSPLLATQSWDRWPEFDARMQEFRDGRLTRGVAYELRALADEFAHAYRGSSPPEGLLDLEARRIWNRKRNETSGDPPVFPADVAASAASLQRFASLLIAARFLTAEGIN